MLLAEYDYETDIAVQREAVYPAQGVSPSHANTGLSISHVPIITL